MKRCKPGKKIAKTRRRPNHCLRKPVMLKAVVTLRKPNNFTRRLPASLAMPTFKMTLTGWARQWNQIQPRHHRLVTSPNIARANLVKAVAIHPVKCKMVLRIAMNGSRPWQNLTGSNRLLTSGCWILIKVLKQVSKTGSSNNSNMTKWPRGSHKQLVPICKK